MGEDAQRSATVTGIAPPNVRRAVTAKLAVDGWTVTDSLTGSRAVVCFELDPEALAERPLRDTDEATWERFAEEPPRRALGLLQRVYASIGAGAGSVVLVQPAVALEGAAGLSAAATGWEAQRQLVKSVARRWGPTGLRVNVVGVAADLIAAPPSDALRTERSLGRADDLAAAADTIALLLRPDAAALNGVTLVADGGALMLP